MRKNYSTDGFGNFSRGTLKSNRHPKRLILTNNAQMKTKGVQVTRTPVRTVMRNPISDIGQQGKDKILKTHVLCFTTID